MVNSKFNFLTPEIDDHRSEAEKQTHPWGVVAKDAELSRWKGGGKGFARSLWCCRDLEEAKEVKAWADKQRMNNRKLFPNAQIVVIAKYQPPMGCRYLRISSTY